MLGLLRLLMNLCYGKLLLMQGGVLGTWVAITCVLGAWHVCKGHDRSMHCTGLPCCCGRQLPATQTFGRQLRRPLKVSDSVKAGRPLHAVGAHCMSSMSANAPSNKHMRITSTKHVSMSNYSPSMYLALHMFFGIPSLGYGCCWMLLSRCLGGGGGAPD